MKYIKMIINTINTNKPVGFMWYKTDRMQQRGIMLLPKHTSIWTQTIRGSEASPQPGYCIVFTGSYYGI